MKIKTITLLTLLVCSAPVMAGNWSVHNGWCQTMTNDGRVMVMLKAGKIGVAGLIRGCPDGPQDLMGSRIAINGNLVPTSQMCNSQTAFRPIESEGGMASAQAREAILSVAGREVSTLLAFGREMQFTRGNMLTVCPKYVPLLTSLPPDNTRQINKASVLKAAKQAYTKEYDSQAADAADFGSYTVRGNTVVFEVYNAGYHTYDKVVVTVGTDGNATSAKVEYMGQ
ncbi:hypothetical protein G3601_005211 [Salmonella enterica]|uniref:Uncharacterized protein n=2 Tax=Salmonella enterica TaxID=28901 RepID=A0A619I4G8_SALER|nr:hypothetical protein [Salmonella enterica subsp. enterica serovar Java]EAN9729379.1 hypothetical protein [Salmonella enterica]EBV8394892.1 hypothetical protein [Salmonella enterica subsp. enterica serovar Virchow]EDQ0183769.1 hypothetical protein [Salmonella enterica subsp. enterica serovar 4,[5],12:b:-]EDV9618303.1 hypothetical protein [Salmonella enterica subsp. enterica serovar Paratyphi B]EEE5613579.1 hypothetical protein [Salmonella enterica subsp. enterica serovar Typhimurium]EHE7039